MRRAPSSGARPHKHANGADALRCAVEAVRTFVLPAIAADEVAMVHAEAAVLRAPAVRRPLSPPEVAPRPGSADAVPVRAVARATARGAVAVTTARPGRPP